MSAILQQARRVFDIEAKAILGLKEKLGAEFEMAVRLILECQGKVVVTGIGKSGQIARKIASTLSSTGTPAIYLHPAEGSHGDLGVIEKKDIVIALSYGGESVELVHVLEYMGRKGIPMIALTGSAQSSLAKSATCVLNVFVAEEACPLGLAPTASSTATLAMGDALAMALLEQRGFRPQDFAEIHPGGSLGFKLLTKVRDVMHSGSSLPLVKLGSPMKEVFSVMTHKDVRGAAGVVDEQGSLVGIVTDGDIRRRLEKSADPLQGTAEQMMSRQPRVIEADELAEKALFLMEQFRINLLFVLDRSASNPQAPVGILHIQDLLKAKVR